MPDLTGQQLGDYLVLRRLGRGAMAEVYLAEQQSLARRVALKVLTSELAGDPSYVTRFQNEARAAAALVHANIVQVYEVGRVNGSHFIAQEYVPGKNLGELLEKESRLKPGLVLDILRQSAAALNKAHEGGIVHRDIKPENLMLAEGGEVKVADFGLARAGTPTSTQLTQVGVTMGTPLYMSPEQIEGRTVDVRSDLYSLGVTAYHLLSGSPPFQGDTPLAVAVQHLNNPATPLSDLLPDLPVRFSQIIAKLIAKKPEKRHQTPGELMTELRDLARQAAAEGWAEGPENWSISDLHPIRSSDAAQRLDTLMKQSAELTGASRPRQHRVLKAAGFLLLGAAVGLASRPEPLLPREPPGVLRKATVLQQLYHAAEVDSEQAWRAVERYFPDLQLPYAMMADQGLARFYLRNGKYAQARDVCIDLFKMAGPADPAVERFAIAGMTVALTALDDLDAAREALALFDFPQIEELEAEEPLLADMLDRAIDRLDSVE